VIRQAKKPGFNLPLHLREKVLPILTSRTVIFFFIMCLLAVLLYAAGTTQGFIDTTQFALLRLSFVLGIFLAATSICGLFLDLGRFMRFKKLRYILRSGGYLFLTFFGIFTVLMAMFIFAISDGNIF
jgi:hypothetical protein